MEKTLTGAQQLKDELVNFVLDAEGELAVALETFSAAQLIRAKQQDMNQQEFLIDRFLIEGRVQGRTPIELFLAERTDLSTLDQALVQSWHQSFMGLFVVVQVLEDAFELRNWTTAKSYWVKWLKGHESAQSGGGNLAQLSRLGQDDILLTQIAPFDDRFWMFLGNWVSLGKLGKPKLAVAIGNFKQNYKPYLYSDAPDLLEEAWRSVERYHHNFMEFFGADEVTLPGYQLSKRLNEFQTAMTQKSLTEAGIDPTKSLNEIATEAGMDAAELSAAAAEMGVDAKAMDQVLKSQSKMTMPQVELPEALRKAEQVTALTHPREGQVFLPNYQQFVTFLAEENRSISSDQQSSDQQSHKKFDKKLTARVDVQPTADRLVKQYLEDPSIPRFVWFRLAQQYPTQLTALLQRVLDRPDFQLATDLDPLLQQHHKSPDLELPEIASVPLHLHDLFQEAVAEVSKRKTKSKPKQTAAGFGRAN